MLLCSAPIKKTLVTAAALCLGAAALFAAHQAITPNVDPNLAPPWVAHAGGGYKGQTYLNCLECFEENYKKGHRLFEFDLMMTSDNFLVAIHDGQEKDYGLPAPPEKFTLEQYLQSKFGNTSRVPESEFVRLMIKYPDWFLVTDVKDDNLRALKRISETFGKSDIDWRNRVVPQVYSPDEIPQARALGFKHLIFTLYRFGNDKAAVKETISANPVWAVTLWANWWDSEWKYIFQKAGVKAMVHTVNDNATAEGLFSNSVAAIYTDFLPLQAISSNETAP